MPASLSALPATLRRWVRRSRTRVLRAVRRGRDRWRSSMQLRVVTQTLAIGVVSVLLLGWYLSTTIRDGLFEQRLDQVRSESARTTEQVRATFTSSPAQTVGEAEQLLADTLSRLQSGGSSAQDFFLWRERGQPSTVNGVASNPDLGEVVSDELRAAVIDGDRQVDQSVAIPRSDGGSDPGVVVGSLVDVPVAGTHELYYLYSFAPEQATLSFLQRVLLLGAVVVLAILGTITWLVTRQAVQPVRRAAQVAERLADGHLTERMPGKGHDEMATLARSFNEMAVSLQEQIGRMEELSTLQRRFVSDVSHELRTPLTTIRMASEVIHASRDELDPAARRSAELLQTQLDRFEDLLADLLEISRFDAGAAVLDAERRDLRDVVTSVVDQAAPLADRKDVWISVVLPEKAVVADIDPRRVERVVRNLVVNAIEHAEERPVEVHVGADDRAVAVVVRDHGVGMSPQEVEHVFDRFWRADPARARTTGGTGLGLAISLEDAHLHGGWLEAWGRLGRGASFRLTLPRRAGIVLEASPLPLVPASPVQEAVPVRTGQVPVVHPAAGPSPSSLPDLGYVGPDDLVPDDDAPAAPQGARDGHDLEVR